MPDGGNDVKGEMTGHLSFSKLLRYSSMQSPYNIGYILQETAESISFQITKTWKSFW